MKDVIVLTSFTHEAGLSHAYRQSLLDAGIDHHFDIMPRATSSFKMLDRITYWRDLAYRFKEYKAIIVTDGWDVIFFGTKEELIKKVEAITAFNIVLISGEKNCFPGPEFGFPDYTDVIKGPTSCRYSNPGMMIARPDAILAWAEQAMDIHPLDISDQAWFNKCLALGPTKLVNLDYSCNLFYVISYNDGRLENGQLQIKYNRLWNSESDTYPNFFHFAGHGPDESRRILPGNRELPRYEAQSRIRTYIQIR